MEKSRFDRLIKMFGEEKVNKLADKRVALFGVGGVGGAVAEALVRGGIGAIDIFDGDTVDITNINRQVIALSSTVGRDKVEVARLRLLDINPDLEITATKLFFLPENSDSVDFSRYDYVIDAIDTVTAKMEIVKCADKADTPVISCMGTGGKQNPMAFEVADIYKTTVCPLARVMRKLCKEAGVKKLKCVYSKEISVAPDGRTPVSCSFTPPAAGLLIAAEVLKDLMK